MIKVANANFFYCLCFLHHNVPFRQWSNGYVTCYSRLQNLNVLKGSINRKQTKYCFRTLAFPDGRRITVFVGKRKELLNVPFSRLRLYWLVSHFFNMGQPRPLLFIFLISSFYMRFNNTQVRVKLYISASY